MNRYLFLALVAACDAPVEMPTTPVACGEGSRGEVLGDVVARGASVHFGEVAPIYLRGSSDAPGVMLMVRSLPRFQLWLWGYSTAQHPSVGDQPPRDAFVRVGTQDFKSPAFVIIDEVDDTLMPACIAGRFSVDFDGELTGRLAGSFRTR